MFEIVEFDRGGVPLRPAGHHDRGALLGGLARHASCGDAEQPFRMFVKHIQSWSRHPFFEFVPAGAVARWRRQGVPWRTEALAYGSDLGDRLPDGLAMARALGVVEHRRAFQCGVARGGPVVDREGDLARFTRAAHLLGRHAASPSVRELLPSVGHTNTVRMYHQGTSQM